MSETTDAAASVPPPRRSRSPSVRASAAVRTYRYLRLSLVGPRRCCCSLAVWLERLGGRRGEPPSRLDQRLLLHARPQRLRRRARRHRHQPRRGRRPSRLRGHRPQHRRDAGAGRRVRADPAWCRRGAVRPGRALLGAAGVRPRRRQQHQEPRRSGRRRGRARWRTSCSGAASPRAPRGSGWCSPRGCSSPSSPGSGSARDSFLDVAHFGAAVPLFALVTGVAYVNARKARARRDDAGRRQGGEDLRRGLRRRRRRHGRDVRGRHRPRRHGPARRGGTPDEWVLWVEVVLLLSFATFWVTQTFDFWADGLPEDASSPRPRLPPLRSRPATTAPAGAQA